MTRLHLVHSPMTGVLCYVWYSEEDTGRGVHRRSVPNATLATASYTAVEWSTVADICIY